MKLHVPVHPKDQEATESGLILVDEFRFPHAVMTINQSEMNSEGLKYAYEKIAKFLDLENAGKD